MKLSYEPIELEDNDVLMMDYFGRSYGDREGNKDHDATLKAFHDWRLTPSLMDPNSFAFNTFVNQPPGYYTPTPGGVNTLYQSQAGDLHTPGMGLNTPLSLQSIHGLSADHGALHLEHFQPHMMHQLPHFHHPFVQPTYAPPSHFLQHEDSGYVAMDNSSHKTTPTSMHPPAAAQQFSQVPNGAFGMVGLPPGEKLVFPNQTRVRD
jgi:hypothetical protein